MTGPHWKARADELRANYTHGPCDAAIIEGRDKDACAGCQAGTGGAEQNIVPLETLELWWDALVRGDGLDREGNHYDLLSDGHHAWRTAKGYRQHLAELRADNERWRIKFEASQLVAGKAIRERAEAIATVDRQALRILALSQDHRELSDALAEIERLQVELADTRSPVLHRGTVLDAVPLRTHDGIRSDKAIRPRGGTG